MTGLLPYLLCLLSFINIVTIWLARRAVLRGNWLIHRNFMVASLAIWGGTLLLFAYYLWMTRLWVLFSTQILFILYIGLAVGVSVALAIVLLRVARHQLLPHKLLARSVIAFWLLACLAGVVMYPLTDAHVLM